MKRFLIVVTGIICLNLEAQVGIGTTSPDSSALLELNSSNSGFLPPRVNLTGTSDITTIPNPVEGLMIYSPVSNCNLQSGIYVFNGSSWRPLEYGDNKTFTQLVKDEIGVSNVTFSTISSTQLNGDYSTLFDDVDNTSSSSFHIRRSGSPTGDWGFSMVLPQAYTITGFILDGRDDCCTSRIENVVIRLYRCGTLVYSSSPITSAVTGDNTVTIPNILANEIRFVVPNGGNTGYLAGETINFTELNVLATE